MMSIRNWVKSICCLAVLSLNNVGCEPRPIATDEAVEPEPRNDGIEAPESYRPDATNPNRDE
ncbi:MAG: hypothetical protein WEB58_09930 [Planctomycetaceae bacterium]